MKKINYIETLEFQKDLKTLLKKFSSLVNDLELVKEAAIELYHIRKINNLSIFPIQGYCSDDIQICKVKKFSCDSLKGKGVKSGIRVIYAFYEKETKVDFLEIYYKGNQAKEDYGRIKAYLKGKTKG
jgi:mRNA-degrading endonuclease RelE of RelBE toxin-antitoxin system